MNVCKVMRSHMDRDAVQGTLSRKHERVVKHIRLDQIVHTTESVVLIIELAITRSKMGLET